MIECFACKKNVLDVEHGILEKDMEKSHPAIQPICKVGYGCRSHLRTEWIETKIDGQWAKLSRDDYNQRFGTNII